MNQQFTSMKIADYSNLPIRAGQVIKFEDSEIVLFKLTSGTVHAVENKSPHPKGGTLVDGLVSGHYVYCPVYDWKISLIDGQVQAPDEGKIKTYPIEIDGDHVNLLI